MIKLADLVFETTDTQGTGELILKGPVTNYFSFASAFSTGDQVAYVIKNDTDVEIGLGTFTAGSPDKLSRDKVYTSSNAGELVNWGSGTRNVFCGPISSLLYHRTENLNIIIGKGTATGDGSTHTVSMDVAPLAYEAGMEINYVCPADNTGAININVDGLGNKALKRNGEDVVEGDFLENDVIRCFYTGVHFEMLLPVRLSDVPLLDEDDFASDSDIKAPSQQSTKAYVDGKVGAISPYSMVPLNIPFPVFDQLTGAVIPDNTGDAKYIKLTAGLTGSGQFNEGLLTSESISGSGRTLQATAVIDLAESPLDGQTVPLLNTENTFLRAGASPGNYQQDEYLSHTHSATVYDALGGTTGFAYGGGTNQGSRSVSSSGGAETRPKNRQVTYYMRIK